MADKLVTIFGGNGFIGRYVSQALMARGARIRIACRNPKAAFFVKALGALGQSQFVAADVTKPDTVTRAVAGADAVINLVGVLSGNFQAVHVDGAANVARAARAAGAATLVHLSAIGADSDSDSAYGATKGEGEQVVRAAFPEATILRPSIVFGAEDHFVNRFAGMIQSLPVVPVIGGDTKFQPIYVADLARAIATATLSPGHAGRTYELGGPEILTMAELNRRIAEMTGHRRSFVSVPDAAAGVLARMTGWMPGAPITLDQWRMLGRDNVAAPGAPGLSDLGVSPTPLAAVAERWLVRYRRHGRFAGRAAT